MLLLQSAECGPKWAIFPRTTIGSLLTEVEFSYRIISRKIMCEIIGIDKQTDRQTECHPDGEADLNVKDQWANATT